MTDPATALTPAPAREPVIYRPPRPGDTPPTTGQRARLLLFVAGLGIVIGALIFGVNFVATLPAGETVNPLAPGDGNLTLLVFVEQGCCAATLATAEQIAAEYRGDVYITLADVDRPANVSLIMQYQIQQLGDMVLLDDRGEAIAAYGGGVPVETLRQVVRGSLIALRQRDS